MRKTKEEEVQIEFPSRRRAWKEGRKDIIKETRFSEKEEEAKSSLFD